MIPSPSLPFFPYPLSLFRGGKVSFILVTSLADCSLAPFLFSSCIFLLTSSAPMGLRIIPRLIDDSQIHRASLFSELQFCIQLFIGNFEQDVLDCMSNILPRLSLLSFPPNPSLFLYLCQRNHYFFPSPRFLSLVLSLGLSPLLLPILQLLCIYFVYFLIFP